MYIYQKTNRYFTQVPDGVESLAAKELETLGAYDVEPAFRGVQFSATPAVFYRINYSARLVSRVLAPLVSFPCQNKDDLYRTGKNVPWSELFSLSHTFGIFTTGEQTEALRNTKYAALCLKDAVVDHFRDRVGDRPNVDPLTPDLWLNLHIEQTKVTISLDASGGSLHRRGYRQRTVDAPLREDLAAAMVALSGWNGERPLYDPMCGSGTILCEAMMQVCDIPSGWFRKDFGFRFLPDFDWKLWQEIKAEVDGAIKPVPRGIIAGSDMDPLAIRTSRLNCSSLPGGDRINLKCLDFKEIQGLENRTIFINPPYGIRMGRDEDLGLFYKELGDFLKQRCKGSDAYIFFGNRELIKSVGLKTALKHELRNAGLDARIAKFELY